MSRYLVTGVASVALYVGGAALAHHALGLGVPLANAAAYVGATVFNYLLNFYWSFRTTRRHAQAAWRYLTLSGAGIVLNSIYVNALVALTPVPLAVAALSFAALWPLVSFAGMRCWAFR